MDIKVNDSIFCIQEKYFSWVCGELFLVSRKS